MDASARCQWPGLADWPHGCLDRGTDDRLGRARNACASGLEYRRQLQPRRERLDTATRRRGVSCSNLSRGSLDRHRDDCLGRARHSWHNARHRRALETRHRGMDRDHASWRSGQTAVLAPGPRHLDRQRNADLRRLRLSRPAGFHVPLSARRHKHATAASTNELCHSARWLGLLVASRGQREGRGRRQ